MNKRGGLGRGLGALISENEYPTPKETKKPKNAKVADKTPMELSVKEISANPYQPRKVFDKEKLAELVASVKEHGVIQPLVVRKKGSKYELVAGERRLRAAKEAKLKVVPVVFKDYTDKQMMEIALVENIQRHDLNPIEEAEGIKKLMDKCGLTQEQAAEKVGRSRTAITNILRLLNLPDEIREYVSRETLTMGQVKPLLALASKKQQIDVAKEIINNDWSSRLVEEVVKELKAGNKLSVVREVVKVLKEEKAADKTGKKPSAAKKDIHHKVFEEALVAYLGTKVRVVAKNEKQGKIEIEYYSADDLGRIYDLLQGKAAKENVKLSFPKSKKFTV